MSQAGPSTLPTVAAGEAVGGTADVNSRKTKRFRLGKREKQALREELARPDAVEDAQATPALATEQSTLVLREDGLPDTDAWSWFPLADRNTATCPVLFNSDCSYCFIASGSLVRIYSVATAQLQSTLTLASATANSTTDGPLSRAKVSCLLLNPANPLQLVVGALDGCIRVWDYTEGTLLRTLDMGAPVQHACAHSSLPDQVFVALVAPVEKKKLEDEKEVEQDRLKSGVYSISLKPKPPVDGKTVLPTTPRSPARRMRLAIPRVVRQLALSPNGAFLVSLNPNMINICRTSELHRGFSTRLDSQDVLTCLAFHPTENYLATGNTKGQIRMWYGILTDSETAESAVASAQQNKDAATSVLHWHVHPVSSLAFTPNGAYLISGGEEAVLVLWQIHTGHREFIPRVGAPIVTVSVTSSVHAEQQIVARLRDGSVIFVGSQKLKISHTITGLKADPVRLTDITNRQRDAPIPLAIQPVSKLLVIPAGHPSSLQFYSPADDAQVLELEISPSNRVTAAGAPLEPTRVERVAFSTPMPPQSGKQSGAYWMATLDAWENGAYTPERHLKFWQYRPEENSFALTTRIDLPHVDKITSFTFSPSPASPLLLTTSLDGSIKLWSYHSSSWACRNSFSYRSFAPLDAAWAADGSMFAVAHARSVTLWSTTGGKVLHSFACPEIAPLSKLVFAGPEGTVLLAGGRHGTMTWDLLTFEETSALTLDVVSLASRPLTSTFLATENAASSSSNTYLVDLAASSSSSTSPAVSHRPLPFAVRQALFLDALLPGAGPNDVALAVVDDHGAVNLVGGALAGALGKTGGSNALPDASKGQSRLFEEIFGAAPEQSKKKAFVETGAVGGKAVGGLEGLDAPAHTLPNARLLWRGMMGGFKVPEGSVGVAKVGEVGGRSAVAKELSAVENAMEIDEDAAPVTAKAVSFSTVDALGDALRAKLRLQAAVTTQTTAAVASSPVTKSSKGR